jgi:hypothetical protein
LAIRKNAWFFERKEGDIKISSKFKSQKSPPKDDPLRRRVGAFGGKMIVTHQKFLKEIFGEHSKF